MVLCLHQINVRYAELVEAVALDGKGRSALARPARLSPLSPVPSSEYSISGFPFVVGAGLEGRDAPWFSRTASVAGIPLCRAVTSMRLAPERRRFCAVSTGDRQGKEEKEGKPKKKPSEESCEEMDRMLASLNFANLGPVPPWTREDADPENGGLTEFHIQVLGVPVLSELARRPLSCRLPVGPPRLPSSGGFSPVLVRW